MQLPKNDIFMEEPQRAPWIEDDPWYNVAATISGVIFLLITWFVAAKVGFFTRIEDAVTHGIQANYGFPKMNYHGGIFHDMLTFAASYGDIVPLGIITVIIAAIVFFRSSRSLGVWMVVTYGVMGVLGLVIKKLVHRARPIGHLAADNGFSFPSGHSLASTLLIWMLIMVLVPRMKSKAGKVILTIILVLVWLLILFSRLYFSAHHLGDVLGGVTLSLAILWYSMSIYARHFE